MEPRIPDPYLALCPRPTDLPGADGTPVPIEEVGQTALINGSTATACADLHDAFAKWAAENRCPQSPEAEPRKSE